MKYLITESQLDRAADAFLTFLLEPHEEKEYPKTGAVHWYKDDNNIVIIRDGYFYVKHKIWQLFSDMFSLKYNETQSYIKKWLEEHYNLKGITPQGVNWL